LPGPKTLKAKYHENFVKIKIFKFRISKHVSGFAHIFPKQFIKNRFL